MYDLLYKHDALHNDDTLAVVIPYHHPYCGDWCDQQLAAVMLVG